jgi:hypothetical protein
MTSDSLCSATLKTRNVVERSSCRPGSINHLYPAGRTGLFRNGHGLENLQDNCICKREEFVRYPHRPNVRYRSHEKHNCYLTSWSNSSVGIALGYGLDDQGSRVRFPAGAGNFSLQHLVQNGYGAYPASYPMGTRCSFPGGKAAGACN